MDLNTYFQHIREDDIRIIGTRIGIETVLGDFLNGSTAEEIALRYPSLTLEKVYATLTYYFAEREKCDAYLEDLRKFGEQERSKQRADPPEGLKRLMKIAAKREAHTS